MAFDQRFNLELAAHNPPGIRPMEPWKPAPDMLTIPSLDANSMNEQPIAWQGWLPPRLLLEFTAVSGEKVRLCDFGSAGEGGSLYASWLPVTHAPPPVKYSRQNPLRSSHL